MGMYAGVDWGSATHAVCVINGSAARIVQFEVKHDECGLTELIKQLRKASPIEPLRIAIERPSRLLIDTLLEAGFVIVPIHPNVVKASRPRYRAAGGKCDRGDAYLLADLLRTDGRRFVFGGAVRLQDDPDAPDPAHSDVPRYLKSIRLADPHKDLYRQYDRCHDSQQLDGRKMRAHPSPGTCDTEHHACVDDHAGPDQNEQSEAAAVRIRLVVYGNRKEAVRR